MKVSRSSSSLRSTKSESALPPRRSNSVDSKSNTVKPDKTDAASTSKKPQRSNSAPPPSRTDSPSSTRPRNPEGASRVNSTEGRPARPPQTNSEIRQWYKQQISQIPAKDAELKAAGASLQDRAKAAYDIRHSARVDSRQFMNPLEAMFLKARDFFTYGRLDGPSFDQLVKDNMKGGLSKDQAMEKIINSSQRTNQTVDSIYARPAAST
jgi:hypothetical protein